MGLNKAEGIVLKSFLIKENDRILTLMTKEMGLVKLYCKSPRKNDYLTHALHSTFTKGEFVFALQEGELGYFREGMVLNQNLQLHEKYDFLMAAHKMSDALLHSQPLYRPSQLLYIFFSLSLEKLPSLPSALLLSTFFIKLLKHEGYLQLDRCCSSCEEVLSESYRFGGELFCKRDAPHGSQIFSAEEEDFLLLLAAAPTFTSLATFSLPDSLPPKIAHLFSQAIQNN